MKYELDKGAHSVYSLYYHLIFVVKYRRKVITPEIDDFIKQKIREISYTFDVKILSTETDKDHVHILLNATPRLDIPKYINTLKTITSREIWRRFQEVKEQLWNNVFGLRHIFLQHPGR